MSRQLVKRFAPKTVLTGVRFESEIKAESGKSHLQTKAGRLVIDYLTLIQSSDTFPPNIFLIPSKAERPQTSTPSTRKGNTETSDFVRSHPFIEN